MHLIEISHKMDPGFVVATCDYYIMLVVLFEAGLQAQYVTLMYRYILSCN